MGWGARECWRLGVGGRLEPASGREQAEGLRGVLSLWAAIPAPGVAPGSCPGLTVRNLEQPRRCDKRVSGQRGYRLHGARGTSVPRGTEQPRCEAGSRLPTTRDYLGGKLTFILGIFWVRGTMLGSFYVFHRVWGHSMDSHWVGKREANSIFPPGDRHPRLAQYHISAVVTRGPLGILSLGNQ